ncbi:flagellar hook-basal body complex protein FliE [Pelagicoccus sp. NFK12]|uniref:Flagellar hook-basal body complex protein FliE n=1 Tax=Pelagicoccus enzymogenes TaxID=2773457 RepID=A0A927IGS5_9BACT|nr:flagellar hook-basal body complex protein FliE [Pelagicoccus enzymogenes]MBD5778680.1 flagellar hook-basal body complex protein FliE [Pelagicoccus enzymogenes]MDQ8196948.1 flagellar hook-basal body complex protein FliE [Pelagicoccus enzymogenes]
MIDSVSNLAAQQLFKTNQLEHQKKLQSVEFQNPTDSLNRASEAKAFDGVIGKFIHEVDAKHKVAAAESNKVLLGEADNVHQAMIASQEAGVAFNMMVEIRNKLVQSYQELMKMPV